MVKSDQAVADKVAKADTPFTRQWFEKTSETVIRHIRCGATESVQEVAKPSVPKDLVTDSSLYAIGALFNRQRKLTNHSQNERLRIVDLCCGVGGFASGIRDALSCFGPPPVFAASVDVSNNAALIYQRNIRPRRFLRENIETLVSYGFLPEGGKSIPDAASIQLSGHLADLIGAVDAVIAGPPCEGHSNANNVTRRSDARNTLYVDAVAIAIALQPTVIVIENVPTVVASRVPVVEQAKSLLRQSGYSFSESPVVLNAAQHGCAQARNRNFLIATKTGLIGKDFFSGLVVESLSAGDVLSEAAGLSHCDVFDVPSKLSGENQRRVEFLHANGLYDLPDAERPDCHRLKAHGYGAVYGRMRYEQPSPTITTGFLSPGRGRFTHPFLARGLTLREGSLLQGFSTYYDWMQKSSKTPRTAYATLIGDAVPPALGFVTGLAIAEAIARR